MAERIRLTSKYIDSIEPAPKGKRVNYFDTEIPALHVRVTDTGAKSFYVRKGKNSERVRLGTVGDISLKDARTLANEAIGTLAKGFSINAEKRKSKIESATVAEVVETYIELKVKKPGYEKDIRKRLKEAFNDWENRPIGSITRDEVLTRFRKLYERSPSRARGAFRVFRAWYNFALNSTKDEQGVAQIPANPTAILSELKLMKPERRRKTLIMPSDIPGFIDAALNLTTDRKSNAFVAGRFIVALLATGWRPEQLSKITWSKNIHRKERALIVHDEETKNNEGQLLPISDQLWEIFEQLKEVENDGGFVFPSRLGGPIVEIRDYAKRLEKQTGISFRPSDARRTFLTLGEALDINMLTLKRLANHKTPENDVTAGYVVPLHVRLRRVSQLISDYLFGLKRL